MREMLLGAVYLDLRAFCVLGMPLCESVSASRQFSVGFTSFLDQLTAY